MGNRFNKAGFCIEWGVVGAHLAGQSDVEQAEFFKGFLQELLFACQSNHAAQMQLAYINDKLTDQERELVSMLGYTDNA